MSGSGHWECRFQYVSVDSLISLSVEMSKEKLRRHGIEKGAPDLATKIYELPNIGSAISMQMETIIAREARNSEFQRCI